MQPRGNTCKVFCVLCAVFCMHAHVGLSVFYECKCIIFINVCMHVSVYESS